MMQRVKLELFDAKVNFELGRSRLVFAIWYLCKVLFFQTALPWPIWLKICLLRSFGCKMGKGCVIKPRVSIHLPWKLEIGNNCWIGEEALILNFEKIVIESNVCISQRVFLCGGNHDYRDPAMSYRNGPIHVEEGAWIGAGSFVGPNIVIGQNAVITAGSVVRQDQPANMICSGNPCKPEKSRWRI
jgi:putative colanic acid biosynthesis acetyltransferase WcaF